MYTLCVLTVLMIEMTFMKSDETERRERESKGLNIGKIQKKRQIDLTVTRNICPKMLVDKNYC